jgi:signal peptidase I
MIKFIKVTGESLSPFFLSGDYVLIGKCSYLFGPIRKGDIVVYTHSSYGLMIKEVDKISSDLQQIHVKGSHPFSLDSSQIGPIATADIIGKVIWHLKKPMHSN